MGRFLIFVFLACSCLMTSAQVNDSLIVLLKQEIEQRNVYVNKKLERIELLRKKLVGVNELSTLQQFDLYNSLYHQYKTFIYDSAFGYAQKLIRTAYKLDDRMRVGYARVKLGFILISSGMFKETFDSLKLVDVGSLTDSSRVDYYRLLARAYSDLNNYNNDDYYRQQYHTLTLQYMDSAINLCAPGLPYFYYLKGVKYMHESRYREALQTFHTLLDRYELPHPQLAMNYFDLGGAYKHLEQPDETVRCLIMSSLSDIRAATKETAAMHTLAKLLYERGDTENAYVFIKQALDDAQYYGARQRKVEIGSILPVIAAAQLSKVEMQRKTWLSYSVGLSVMVLVVACFSVIVYIQLKKLKAADAVITEANAKLQRINQKLREADKIKEEYIGYYFNTNAEYIDKIEVFKNDIDRKIQSKKVDEIRYVVNTINPSHEREELYFNFDKIFLKLFPDFVTTFNSYFESRDQIVLKENQLLNTELRIFALIRLGIHDSEKIARILGYSVNTIYAYKNRVKSKSTLPNDQFEQKIMEIKTVSVS